MFTSAWKVSVDAREKVRGQAAEVFGKDAEWTRSFDFQKPVEGYGSIKGFRFMNDGENTRMFVIRHDGNFELFGAGAGETQSYPYLRMVRPEQTISGGS